MRIFIALVVSTLASACGSSEAEDRQAAQDWAYVEETAQAQAAASAGLDQIGYPECGAVWERGKATPCGRRTHAITMTECRRRALIAAGRGSAILDEFAGPSWVAAAGLGAVASDETRIAKMEKYGYLSSFEVVAVALGNGTSDIEHYNCELQEMRLTEVNWFGRKPVF